MKPLIILHLYYTEMWDEFNDYFKKLDTDFDLIVTIPDENKEFCETIQKSYKECKIFILPNKGLDIGPFLIVLKYLKENNLEYSHIVKLHTKKSHYNPFDLGLTWRNSLVKPLIGSSDIFKSNLDLISNSCTIKMCGSSKWLLRTNRGNHEKTLTYLNVTSKTSSFIGGTIFISDYKTIVDFFTIEQLDNLYNRMPIGYVRDNSVAHDIERVFGFIMEDKGYLIKGV